MWLFTKHGFFSAVQHREFKDVIHLRARFKGDLERLAEAYGLEVHGQIETPDADYRFRVDVSRETFEKIVLGEARDIDYTNFKAAATGSEEWHNTLMDVWGVLRMGQARAKIAEARSNDAFDALSDEFDRESGFTSSTCRTDAASGGKRRVRSTQLVTTPRRVSSKRNNPKKGKSK